MKKILVMMLAMLTICFAFSSCSSDDEDNECQITKEMVVGTWDVTSVTENGYTMNVTTGNIRIVLRDDNTYSVKFYSNQYIGTYTISDGLIVGTTLDPIKEYFRFDKLNGNKATVNYSNSVGDKYVFQAVKLK